MIFGMIFIVSMVAFLVGTDQARRSSSEFSGCIPGLIFAVICISGLVLTLNSL